MATIPIGSMYGIYANIWGILMVNVTIYSIHGSYGLCHGPKKNEAWNIVEPRHDQWYPVVILGILTNHDSHRTNVL